MRDLRQPTSWRESFASRYGVPASAGRASAYSDGLKVPKIGGFACAPPPEGGTPYPGLGRLAILAGICLLFPRAVRADELKTESRAPYLHHIPLRDVAGQLIAMPPLLGEDGKLVEARANPYSPAETCGRCHEYAAIGRGWHFNAGTGDVKPGRPGEPWILTDPATHTQIPVSYRGWKGTFKPGDIGMSESDFLNNFAHHLPGGGVGEPAKINVDDPKAGRMQITGTMQIDCLICHQSEGRYNHEAQAVALKGQDFKWAPSIGAGLGVFGSFRTAAALADSWKPGRPVTTNLPPIKYERSRFDVENNVFFEVARQSPNEACYFCHTSETHAGDARYHSDQDIHIRAGMKCVDCHRNGIDHMTVRGYEGEIKDRAITADMIDLRAKLILRDNPSATDETAKQLAGTQLKNELGKIETLSCRGCHLGTEKSGSALAELGGRLGSPLPVHRGLPPVHLEKLSCTACHSGPLPEAQPEFVHTAMAHKLGLPGQVRGENTAPVIVEPVFLRGEDGKIGPFKMVWPSYWGRMTGGKITPILPEIVAKTGSLPSLSSTNLARDPYNTAPLTTNEIQHTLEALSAVKDAGEAVFIAAGKLYRLEGGKLSSAENEAAKPYSWALAHDVRPARQALGAAGCADCHSLTAPVYFSEVTARGPVAAALATQKAMWEFRGDDIQWASKFAFTFKFRTMLKIISFGSALLSLGVLLSYALAGLGSVTRWKTAGDDSATEVVFTTAAANGKTGVGLGGKLAYTAMLLAGIAMAVTGIGTFMFGQPPMTHWVLMAHVSAAPLFAIGLALVALTWTGGSRANGSGPSCLSQTLLWLILLGGLLVVLTGVVPMTPIFGTQGQHLLYLTHRYGAIVFSVAVVLHLLSLAGGRKQKRQ